MCADRVIGWMLPVVMTLALVCNAHGQSYPTQFVRIVLPFAPGGGADSVTRTVAQKLTGTLGQPVIVDNRPGASGNIGIRLVAKATPDGYTLLSMSSNFVINPTIYSDAGYDPIKDFEPVAQLDSYMLFLVCHPSLPVRSVKALIALAKEQRGKLSYASGGVATAGHLAAEMFNSAVGIRMTHVPYKGTGPAIYDTLGGHVPIIFGVPEVVPHVKEGRLAILAVTGASRSGALPNVPTIAESGVQGYEFTSWHAIFAPAGTSAAVVKRLNEEIRKAVAQPDIKVLLKQQGLELTTGTPQELSSLVKATFVKSGKAINDAQIKVE